jgi:F1F0 ATPase subunit 2
MTMHEFFLVAATAVAGGMLGAMFFGGLWLTVRKGVASPRPALWFFCSLLFRMGIALAGFYFVAGGRWERLLACLLGFVAARLIVMRMTKSKQEDAPRPEVEAPCAP